MKARTGAMADPTAPRTAHRRRARRGPLGVGQLTDAMTLRAAGVELRPLRAADWRIIVRLSNTPEVARYLSMPITTRTLFEQYLRWVRRQSRLGLGASFAILADRQVVGLMQIRVTHPGVGELGWLLHPKVWGSQVFGRAATLLLRFAFERLRLTRLEARVALPNVRARRAVAKIGAVREGTLAASLRLRGEYLDEELWAISDRRPEARTRPRRQGARSIRLESAITRRARPRRDRPSDRWEAAARHAA